MKIGYHRKFQKSFKKLPPNLKQKTIETIEIFLQNPNDRRIKNHKLKGKLKKFRAICVAFDLRIVFEEGTNYVDVLFLDIGSHTVYK